MIVAHTNHQTCIKGNKSKVYRQSRQKWKNKRFLLDKKKNIHINRQKDRQTARQADRQTGSQPARQWGYLRLQQGPGLQHRLDHVTVAVGQGQGQQPSPGRSRVFYIKCSFFSWFVSKINMYMFYLTAADVELLFF